MEQSSHPGELISGRYELVEVIGTGGFGRVWKARDQRLQADVAIKELRPPSSISETERRERLNRAEREALNTARLRDHPHIVSVHDVVVDDGVFWIVMQLVTGRALSQRLQDGGALSVSETADLARALLKALDAAHQAGIVHRDIKPANVLLADNGDILLTDFGIATHETDTSLTITGAVIGSVAYMAPERALGDKGQAPSDLFSLGVTLFEALEGLSPFARTSTAVTLHAVAYEDPPPLRRAGPLAPLITRLLTKDPAQRPSIAEALALLDAIPVSALRAADAPGLAKPTAPPPPAQPPTPATPATPVTPATPPHALPTMAAMPTPTHAYPTAVAGVHTPPQAYPATPMPHHPGYPGQPGHTYPTAPVPYPPGGPHRPSSNALVVKVLAGVLGLALVVIVVLVATSGGDSEGGTGGTGGNGTGGGGETEAGTFVNDTSVEIRDNETAESTIEVTGVDGNAPAALAVPVDLTHTNVNDLDITLAAPDGTTFVLDEDGPHNDGEDGSFTYTVNAAAVVANGTWTLAVEDTAGLDQGTLNSWGLHMGSGDGGGEGEGGGQTGPVGGSFENNEPVTIPDMDSAVSTIEVTGIDGNAPSSLAVPVDITHDYTSTSELDITLTAPDGTTFTLNSQDEEHNGGESGVHTYVVDASAVPANGTWTLTVEDIRAIDEGTLNSWGLRFQSFANNDPVAIPDMDSAVSTIEVSGFEGNAPSSLAVPVDITHDYTSSNELDIRLTAPDGTTFTLNEEEEHPSSGEHSYVIDASAVPANGTWTLTVEDIRAADEGTLNSWGLLF
ncbi:proprotein convertase P-domain-containing protein [Streptomyces sp. 4N509B]|uniref:proprotein convertase P-domain-containing protein n=1 Tax=Streptomyces sp. 4N509B TaxID=3457413 RepID=UPI003FD30AD1